MMNKKTWEEFRQTGLLLFVNQFLHIFGWAIVVEIEEDEAIKAYPARVKYRGFSEELNNSAYKKISSYMYENAAELNKEVTE